VADGAVPHGEATPHPVKATLSLRPKLFDQKTRAGEHFHWNLSQIVIYVIMLDAWNRLFSSSM
jgi:hypothetical protein